MTGRKLACDTYGGIGRIGVDRSAAYMARKIARDIVQDGYAEQCEIQIAYAIGMEEPVSVNVDCFGTEFQPLDFIQAYVGDSYDWYLLTDILGSPEFRGRNKKGSRSWKSVK